MPPLSEDPTKWPLVERIPLEMARFVFPIPGALPVPNGHSFAEHIGDEPYAEPDPSNPPVRLVLHRVTSSSSTPIGMAEAVAIVERRLDVAPPPNPLSGESAEDAVPQSTFTVVEGITTAASPDDPPPDWDGEPENLPPRADPFMRVLRLLEDLVRALRLTHGDHIEIPSYERLPFHVLYYLATGALEERTRDGSDKVALTVEPTSWGEPQLMLLNHLNLPAELNPPRDWSEVAVPFEYWMSTLRAGTPFTNAKERLIEAHHALYRQGDYADAVTRASTASEVLLAAFISALLWEEDWKASTKTGVESATSALREGRISAEAKRVLTPRLRGNWSSSESAWEVWHRDCQALRNRVVHAGYRPTRLQAAQAIEAARGLERFLLDQLAARRSTYPRVTMMVVAPDGLQRRGLWSGTIRRFARDIAPSEPSWTQAFSHFHRQALEAGTR